MTDKPAIKKAEKKGPHVIKHKPTKKAAAKPETKKGFFTSFIAGKPTIVQPVKPTTQPAKPSPKPTIVPATGKKRALLIGINYIGTQNELNGCINDVKNVKNALMANYNFKAEDIVLLSDDQTNPLAKPTKANIIANITKIVGLTKATDELFIHYSGHGTRVLDVNGDEKLNVDAMGNDDAICPADFGNFDGNDGFIVDDDLRKMIVDKLPKGSKLRAIFDCCHSGSALDLPFMYKLGETYTAIEPTTPQTDDCLLISGCRDFQTSSDAYIDKQYAGALTWALLKALDSATKVKTNWKDLLLVIRHHLATGGYDQIPMLSLGNKDIGKTFVDL